MTNKEFLRYIKSQEFKELLQKYEDFIESGVPAYLEVDDLLDIAEYYHYTGNLGEAERCMHYCLEEYPDEVQPLLFLARMYLVDYDDAEEARNIIKRIKNTEKVEAALIRAELFLIDGDVEKAHQILLKRYEMEKKRNASHNNSDDSYSDDVDSYSDDVDSYNDDVDSYSDDVDSYNDGEDDNDEDISDDILYQFPIDVAGMFIDRGEPDYAEKWLQIVPCEDKENDLNVMDITARILMERDDNEGAIVIWNKIIDRDAYNVTAWLKLCDAQYKTEKFEDALQSAIFAHDVSPKDVEPYMAMGNCYFSLGDGPNAMKMFKKYLEMVPYDIYVSYLIGMLHISMGNNYEAFKTLSGIVENIGEAQEIDQSNFFFTYSNICIQLNYYKEAEKAVRIYKSLGAKDYEIEVLQGELEFEKGNQENGLQHLSNAIMNENISIECLFRLASILFKHKLYSATYNLCKTILSRFGEFDKLFFEASTCPFLAATSQKLGMKEECIEYLKKAIETNPEMVYLLFKDQFPPDTPIEDYPLLIVIDEASEENENDNGNDNGNGNIDE